MLSLSLGSRLIPLAPDFTMDLVWKNPACFFDKIPGAYGLSISFPINDFTRSLFGNPERFARYRHEKDQQFPGFEVRFSGVLLMAGTLSIINTSGGVYEAVLVDQLGTLGEGEAERDILDFSVFNQPIPWVNCSNYAPQSHPYCCFPVQNSEFFKDKGVKVKRSATVPDTDRNWWEELWGIGKTREVQYETEVINFLYNKSVQSRVNALAEDQTIQQLDARIDLRTLHQKDNTYESGQVSVITPFFYLDWVITRALQSSGFHITDSFLKQDDHLKNLVIYNNFDITAMEFDVKELYLMMTTPIGEIAEFSQIDYAQSLGRELKAYIRTTPETILPKNHLPRLRLGALLLSTQNLLNVCFHFLPNKTVKVYSRDLLLSAPAFDLNRFFTGSWDIGSREMVSLSFVRETDPNDLIFAERFTHLDERLGDIKEPLNSWANLLYDLDQNTIRVGDIHYLTIPGIFVEYKWLTETKVDPQTKEESTRDFLGWSELSIGYQNGWYKHGREKVEEIKTQWAPVFGLNDASQPMAIVRQKGNTNAWKDAKTDFSPRLLIQHSGTSGAHELDDFSFEYEKPGTGILPNYWKNWNRFWANRLPVAASFDLPVSVLRYMIENICQKYRTREGEFMIEEMRTSVSVHTLKATQVKGYKVD